MGGRNPERGAIAFVVAAMWMMLFGIAAFAVDIGYQYQAKRGLQAATDAAVRAGMPLLKNSASTAISTATAMATANGYTDGGASYPHVSVTQPTGNELQVQIQISPPTFFLGFLGNTSRTVSAVSTGQLVTQVQALFAGNGCSGTGIVFNGNIGPITGDVHSNGKFVLDVGTGTPPNAISGVGEYVCSASGNGGGAISVNGTPCNGGTACLSSSTTQPMPLSWTTADFPCTYGNLTTSMDVGSYVGAWASGNSSGGTLNSGVYCGSSITLGTTGTTGTVTFVSTGSMSLNGTNAHLTAYRHGILAMSTATGMAIQVGNSGWNLNGTLFAPNGDVMNNAGTFTQTGSIVAQDITLGGGTGWSINATGGAGTPTWTMVQ